MMVGFFAGLIFGIAIGYAVMLRTTRDKVIGTGGGGSSKKEVN